jgi:hypothetical protein
MAQTRAYIQPIDSTGALVTTIAGHGRYTLTAGATYYYVIGRTAGAHQSITLTGHTAALVITSATIQDTDHSELDYTNFDATVGIWINEDPAGGFVPVDGIGWTVSNSVVASAGSAVGGARWNLGEDGATRTRLTIVVGGTGGDVTVSAGSKAP